jgi:hypothetical protein
MRNRPSPVPVYLEHGINHHAVCAMENAEKYRQFAEECKRLAERASAKDKAVLMEISQAWEQCAEEADRKIKKTVDGKGSDDINATPD